MKTQNHEIGWVTNSEASLTKKDLREGYIYSIPFLSKNGVTVINECIYAVINNQVFIHRSANWEDVPRSDLRFEAFLSEKDLTVSELPSDLPCFVDLEQKIK